MLICFYATLLTVCTDVCSSAQQHDPHEGSLIENNAFNYRPSVCHDNRRELSNNRRLIITHFPLWWDEVKCNAGVFARELNYQIIHDFIKPLVLSIRTHNNWMYANFSPARTCVAKWTQEEQRCYRWHMAPVVIRECWLNIKMEQRWRQRGERWGACNAA